MELPSLVRWLARVPVVVLAALAVAAVAPAQQASNPELRAAALFERLQQRDLPDADVQKVVADALELVASNPQPELEALARIAHSDQLQRQARYPEAWQEAQAALQQALELEQPVSDVVQRAQYQVGVAAYRRADYATALVHAREALRGHQERQDVRAEAQAQTLVGAIQRRIGNYEASLEAHMAALRISEAREDVAAVARSQNNIGLILWKLEDHDAARSYLQRALGHFREQERERSIASVLSNLGLIEVERGRADVALPLLEEALPIFERLGARGGTARVLSNLAFAYEKLGRDLRALQSQRRAIAIRKEIGDKHGLVRSRGMMAGILLRRGEFERALALTRSALQMAEEIGVPDEQATLQAQLAELLEKNGDPSGALEALRQSHQLELARASAESERRIARLERERASERHGRELAEVRAEANGREAELRSELLWQRVWLIGSCVVAVGMLLLAFLFGQRQRALRALRVSHAELQASARRLTESERRYRTLFEGAMVPTVVVDLERRAMIEWNEPARRLCGLADRSDPQPIDALAPEWARLALEKLFEREPDGDVAVDDCWMEPSGRVRWTEVRGSAVTVEGRACQLVSFRDTTEIHEHQEARIRADKLESLGVMAGGIAHEFNNALTGIVGHVSLARMPDAGDVDESLRLAERAAVQAGELTRKLLAFARGGVPSREVADVGSLLREAAEAARVGSRLRIEVDVDQGLHAAELDAGQFTQLVADLVQHAVQATSGRGLLRVHARNFRGRPDARSSAGERDYVCISFTDDGVAIPEDLRSRIFDPYFSTRSPADGLGLATAFAIASRHDGALTVQAGDGPGTTFEAFFPAAVGASASSAASGVDAVRAPSGSILVLEDDAMVQGVYLGVLQKLGYRVEVVADGEDAVARFAERHAAGDPFDLLIMDLTIPRGVGGKQAFERIRGIDPEARAIVASGYSDDPAMVRHRDVGFISALPKPFVPDELARVVARHVVG